MADRTEAPVIVGTRGSAGLVVMDRQESRNALNAPMVRGIVAGLETHAADPALSCVVLAASGTAFCSGADLRESDDAGGRTGIRMYADLVRAILSSPLPVIARVQGPAVAGGVGLVAACHLAVASAKARFFTPEVRSGLYPLMVHALIESTVGRKRAFSMGLTGAQLDARLAAELGLVNAVVDETELDATIDSWAGSIADADRDGLTFSLTALASSAGLRVEDRVRRLQLALDELSERRPPR